MNVNELLLFLSVLLLQPNCRCFDFTHFHVIVAQLLITPSGQNDEASIYTTPGVNHSNDRPFKPNRAENFLG